MKITHTQIQTVCEWFSHTVRSNFHLNDQRCCHSRFKTTHQPAAAAATSEGQQPRPSSNNTAQPLKPLKCKRSDQWLATPLPPPPDPPPASCEWARQQKGRRAEPLQPRSRRCVCKANSERTMTTMMRIAGAHLLICCCLSAQWGQNSRTSEAISQHTSLPPSPYPTRPLTLCPPPLPLLHWPSLLENFRSSSARQQLWVKYQYSCKVFDRLQLRFHPRGRALTDGSPVKTL